MIDRAALRTQIAAGLLGGLVGGVTIWIYEVVDQTLLRKVASPYQIVENTSVLVFGPKIREFGLGAFALGLAIHFATALAWGVLFALIWPPLRRRKVEAALAGGVYGLFAWVVMHNGLLAVFSPNPPAYTPFSIVNGFLNHTWAFAVPLALVVKARLASLQS